MTRATIRPLRAVFWDDTHHRARTPWLILLPLVGAYAATSTNDLVPFELPAPVAQLLATGAPAVIAVLLVMFSRRFLGGRNLTDYGLAIDRRWWIDLTLGLAVGLLAVSIPFLIAMGAGWAEIVATFDAGDLALWPGIALYMVAMLCTGFWEELVLRGVFLCNTADGLRRWLSPHRAIAGGLALSAVVFAVGHLGQTGMSVTLLTFVLSGVVLGIVYLASGNLALVIGAHAAFNTTANVLFARAGGATDGLSAIMRIEVDPSLTLLRPGGLLEAAAFLLVGLFALLWLRHSRDTISIDLAALHLDDQPDAFQPAPAAASASVPSGREFTDVRPEIES
jgi:uncharacterized protein